LGGLETKNAINFILEDDIKSAFAILLTYYDKLYTKGLHQRSNLNELLHKINCTMVNAAINSNAVLHHNAIIGQAATQP
jgi:tRNA 2-selenouridine synthase